MLYICYTVIMKFMIIGFLAILEIMHTFNSKWKKIQTKIYGS